MTYVMRFYNITRRISKFDNALDSAAAGQPTVTWLAHAQAFNISLQSPGPEPTAVIPVVTVLGPRTRYVAA